MSFPDYKSLVLLEYERLKKANNLPLGLLHPSPAKLKKECMEVCSKRFSKKDERVLNDFFGTGADKAVTLDAIKQCDVDKFRPLVNFINRDTVTPDPKIIELLAWMIDFQPRPFDYQTRYSVPDENENFDGGSIESNPARSESEPGDRLLSSTPLPTAAQAADNVKKTTGIFKLRNLLFAAILLAMLAGAMYWFSNKPSFGGSHQCMYWSGDRYEPIECSQKKEGVIILALDTVKIKYFRRVTRPDTITYAAISYLWYAKMSNSIEFYTSPGVHPLDLQKRLRPITAYIIDKYVLNGSPGP